MRKSYILTAVIIAAFALFAAPAYAGIFDGISESVVIKLLSGALAAVFTVAGLLGYQWAKWRKIGQEGLDVGVEVYKSTRSGSPGGAKITGGEFDGIAVEFDEFRAALRERIVASDPTPSNG